MSTKPAPLSTFLLSTAAILLSIIMAVTSDQLQDCPTNWHRFENKCLFVNTTAVHSKINEQLCSSLNASMVTISNSKENEFIRRLIFIHYESHKWIWLSRARNFNASTGQPFQWSSNERSINYTNWVSTDSVDCNVCCEIALMTSGHWFPSHCNSWSFIQMCQIILTSGQELNNDEYSTDRFITDKNTETAFSGNFYLSQFTNSKTKSDSSETKSTPIDNNLGEMFDYLFYELENIRHDILSMSNVSISESMYEDALVSRDTYLLTLLSLTISLLLIIMIAVAISYYMLVQRLNSMDCLIRN